jgi:hypothetical protein
MLKFIHMNISKLHSEEIISRYGELFKEFKHSDNIVINGYYILFMIRRLILALSFNLFKDYTIIQISMVILSCWSIVLYLVIYKPYIQKMTNMIQISVEICISIAYTVLILLLKQELDQEAVGWIVFLSVNLSYIINLLPILMDAVKKLILRIRAKRDDPNLNANIGMRRHSDIVPSRNDILRVESISVSIKD